MKASENSRVPERLPWTVAFGNIALFIYASTSIFYIFPSGMPQIPDYILALAMVMLLLGFMMRRESRFDVVFLYALGFGFFTFLINMIHFTILPDPTFIKSSLYYIFNASVFVVTVFLMRRTPEKTWRVLYYGLVAAIILELLYVECVPSLRGFRTTGTFFNPNQLAVWALLASCMLVLLKARARLNVFDLCLLLGLGYIQTLSLSKAGLVCFGLLGVTLLVLPALTLRMRLAFLFACVLLLIFGFFEISRIETLLEQYQNIDQALSRLEDIGGEEDDSLEGRGYNRIWQNPEFVIFGAGEGGYLRFAGFSKALEMHSGVGTLVFSYGVIGLTLFFMVLYAILYKNSALVFCLVSILFLYGLTHQNIRFTPFWLFLGICYAHREIDFRPLALQKTALYPPRAAPVRPA